MTPQQFVDRYSALWPPEAREIVGAQKFARFDPARVSGLPVHESEKQYFLVGMPEDAAPMLNFGGGPYSALQPADSIYSEAPAGYAIFGYNNYGDPICLELATGAVVYLVHDGGFTPVFMNSSVSALAASLYAYQSAVFSTQWDACSASIAASDPRALEPGNFWPIEIAQGRESWPAA